MAMKTNNDGSDDHNRDDRDKRDNRDDHDDDDDDDDAIENINDDTGYKCTFAHTRARPYTFAHWHACTPAHTH